MAQQKFYRHFKKKGVSFYWILFAYLLLGYFFPLVGFVAFICMVGPVLTSLRKGRFWCGNICPSGNMYDRLLSKYSPHKPIPKFVRTFGFRLFMVFFIFTLFGVQFYLAWGDWNGMAQVFWRMVLITTTAGVVLSFIYAPRTWCTFCPMGTISSWVAPRKGKLPIGFKSIHVADNCAMKCKSCSRVCPMQLAPYDCRGQAEGYLHPDCIKCGNCVQACPTKITEMRKSYLKQHYYYGKY